jgi:hypothetical protein
MGNSGYCPSAQLEAHMRGVCIMPFLANRWGKDVYFETNLTVDEAELILRRAPDLSEWELHILQVYEWWGDRDERITNWLLYWPNRSAAVGTGPCS